MATLQALMDRFRRASRDTFNAHFLPWAETERDHEAFSVVEGALLQVMVLDHLGCRQHSAPCRAYPEITCRPRRAGVTGTLQKPEGGDHTFDERTTFAYIFMLDFTDDWSAKELDFVLAEIVGGPEAGLIGEKVVLRWSDVMWIDPRSA